MGRGGQIRKLERIGNLSEGVNVVLGLPDDLGTTPSQEGKLHYERKQELKGTRLNAIIDHLLGGSRGLGNKNALRVELVYGGPVVRTFNPTASSRRRGRPEEGAVAEHASPREAIGTGEFGCNTFIHINLNHCDEASTA